jgi:hypothetical protein
MTIEELEWYGAGGFLWEHIFSMAMAEAFRVGDIVRPGEFMVEGIIGSPDNWNIVTNRIIETKATWRSERKLEHLEKHFWLWLVQMQGYCRMVGSREAELYVLFINGTYAPPKPNGRALLLEWSQREIEDNWRMITGHARKRGWI